MSGTALDKENDIPLVVDLDGTLIRSDLLVESFFALLPVEPWVALGSLKVLLKGKSSFKAHLAERAVLDLASLPVDANVLEYLRAEKAKGRRIYLASASDSRYVRDLAAHLGVFDGTFGSSPEINLSGRNKADLLCEKFGEKGFDYIGNDWVDLEVWSRCRRPIIANAPPRLVRKVRETAPDALEISQLPSRLKTYLRALRVHQWLKNILIFIPLLASHMITGGNFLISLAAALAFSLAASSAYLLNDLVDIASDRDHATKRFRPLPSGALPLVHGLALAPLLLGAAIAIGAAISLKYLIVLLLYCVITLSYSFYLKRKAMIDVLVLAGLYTLRILAGNAALAISPSFWLLGFSMFIFLCLALIKRYIELVGRIKTTGQNPRGRAYVLEDGVVLMALAGAAGYSSVLTLILYFNSLEVHKLYSKPEILWFVCPPLLYWISRTLLLAHRGLLHDDPVVYAATDRISQITGLVMLCIVLAAV